MSRYYDMNGNPMELFEWVAAFESDPAAHHVGRDEIGDVQVSTVWLGIDQSFGAAGPPLIFETMIFGGDHDRYQERYSTIEAARAGHLRAVELVKNAANAEAADFYHGKQFDAAQQETGPV